MDSLAILASLREKHQSFEQAHNAKQPRAHGRTAVRAKLSYWMGYLRRRTMKTRLPPIASKESTWGSGMRSEVTETSSNAASDLPYNPMPIGWPTSGAPGATVWFKLTWVQSLPPPILNPEKGPASCELVPPTNEPSEFSPTKVTLFASPGWAVAVPS